MTKLISYNVGKCCNVHERLFDSTWNAVSNVNYNSFIHQLALIDEIDAFILD